MGTLTFFFGIIFAESCMKMKKKLDERARESLVPPATRHSSSREPKRGEGIYLEENR